MPPVTLRQRRRALQRGSTFPPIGLTSALDRPGPLGCWSHADCGGYGKCVNGKCQYPIANPSQAACRTDADCNVFEMCSWGVCVEASPGITAHPHATRSVAEAEEPSAPRLHITTSHLKPRPWTYYAPPASKGASGSPTQSASCLGATI